MLSTLSSISIHDSGQLLISCMAKDILGEHTEMAKDILGEYTEYVMPSDIHRIDIKYLKKHEDDTDENRVTIHTVNRTSNSLQFLATQDQYYSLIDAISEAKKMLITTD